MCRKDGIFWVEKPKFEKKNVVFFTLPAVSSKYSYRIVSMTPIEQCQLQLQKDESNEAAYFHVFIFKLIKF
jgi:hypothetical protein